MMYLVALCLVSLTPLALASDYESHTAMTESGLLFLKTNDIIITGDSWTIVLSVNVTQHLESAVNFKQKVNGLKNLPGIDELEVNRLLRVTDELVDVTEAMNDILSKHIRMKRFLDLVVPISFNFGSDIDPEEIEQLKFGLGRLEGEQENQRKLIEEHISFTQGLKDDIGQLEENLLFQRQLTEEHITFTNRLNEKVENNIKRITYLAEAVTEELIKIEKQFKYVESNFKIVEERIDYLRNQSSKLRILQVEIMHSLVMANRLQHALEMAGEGQLSFYLLSPKELQKELIKISSLLPSGSKLLRGLSVEDMYKYREMAKVVVMANAKQIFIAIRLPLTTIETSFSAYAIEVMPIFNKDDGYAVKVEPESKYVVVSNDRQHYGLADGEYFKKCSGKKPMICPADITLLSRYVPTCIGASYFGDIAKIGTSCNKKLVLSGEEFAWFEDKENRGWVYSLKEDTSVTLACHEKMAKTITLERGIGFLSNTSHCRIIADSFKLLRASAGGSSLKHDDVTYLLKPFLKNTPPTIFSDDERLQLSNVTKLNLLIDGIKTNKRIKKDTSRLFEISFEDLFDENEVKYERIEDLGIVPVGHHHHLGFNSITLVVICAVVSVVLSVITVFIVLLICSARFRANSCKCTAQSRSAIINSNSASGVLLPNQNPFEQETIFHKNLNIDHLQ